MSLDHDMVELAEVVERDPKDAEAVLDLARRAARAEEVPPALDLELARETLAELFLEHPQERALWDLVLVPLGFQVLGKRIQAGAWWGENDRLGEDEDHFFDRESGLPLALRRWEDGAEMLLVPALGGLESAYWLDRFPVTRAQWEWIVQKGERGPPPGFLPEAAPEPEPEPEPPTGWLDRLASLFAHVPSPFGPDLRPVAERDKFASHDYHYKVQSDLPTARLWSTAARGTDGRRYPWGDTSPTAQHASTGATTRRLVPVDSTPLGEGPFGHRDLVGNTMEILSDTQEGSSPMSNKGYRSLAGSDYPGILGFRLAERVSFLPISLRYLDRRPAPWKRPRRALESP
jgi:hypothetical protein